MACLRQEEALLLGTRKARVDAMAEDGVPIEPFEVNMREYLANPSAADELTHARVAHWNAVGESDEVYRKIAALLCEQDEDSKRLRRN